MAAHSVASSSFLSASRSNWATVISAAGSRAAATAMRSSARALLASSSARNEAVSIVRPPYSTRSPPAVRLQPARSPRRRASRDRA